MIRRQRLSDGRKPLSPLDGGRTWWAHFEFGDHAIEVIENSRIEMVLPKHGPTDGADSIPE